MYATKENMLERYTEADLIQLTDRAEPLTNEIDDDILNASLSDASALIDSYLSGRFKLPIPSVPAALTIHACQIAYYSLHQGRYPEEVRTAYEDSISFMEKVSSGRISLDVGGQQPQSSAAIAEVSGPDQAFSRDTLKGF